MDRKTLTGRSHPGFTIGVKSYMIQGVTIPSPTKVIATHLTYKSRAAERGKNPAFPSYFLKPTSSITQSDVPVCRPSGCELLAFEGEIAIIIGKKAFRIDPSEGWSHVGWITAANDFGVYDLRYADSGSNLRSKGIDGFTPLGPNYINATEVNESEIRLQTWVNGKLVQNALTGEELLFTLGTIVADLARLMTLEPGDIILTGTPTGSTIVQPGDIVEVEVTSGTFSSGRLVSPIIESPNILANFGAMPRIDDDSRSAAMGNADAAEITNILENQFGDLVSKALSQVSTATIASQLNKRGLHGCMLNGLSSSHPTKRMIGFARTVRYLPLREDIAPTKSAGMNAQKRAVESIKPGEVLVISARGETNAGTIGDILALRAQILGAVGIITDGAIRDSSAIAALDIPTYSASSHPAVLGRKHVPWETDVAISCADALIIPGDLLVGDADGVVVLPMNLVAEIIEAALEQEFEEQFIAQQIALGKGVAGLYPMNAEWRITFSKWRERKSNK